MSRLLLALGALLLSSSVALAAQSITFAWDPSPAPGVTGYQIQRCTGSADCAPVDLPGATTPGATTWTDTTVERGQISCYAVVAVQGPERSGPSNVVCAATFTEPGTARSLLLKFAGAGGMPPPPPPALAPAGPYPLLPHTSYAGATASSAEEPTYAPAKAIDGVSTTQWHTAFTISPLPAPPYWLLLDLGEPNWVDGLRYLPRQDSWTNGMIVDYTIEVSPDTVAWVPVAQGTFPITTRDAQTVRFPAQQGRYVRLNVLRSANDGSYGGAAEVGVYGVEPPPVAPSSPTGLFLSFP